MEQRQRIWILINQENNMVIYKEQLPFKDTCHCAVVNEIDKKYFNRWKAHTPLIISGRGTQSSNLY